MKPPDLSHADPRSLACLLGDDAGSDERLWDEGELGAILQHQLDAELQFDLGRCEQALGLSLHDLLRPPGGPPLHSFRDLLGHPRPPLALLELTRQFAKTCRIRGEGPMPEEIATILYLTSIAAAMVRLGQRITKLDDEALCYGLDWALEQPWLDESIRQLLRRGRQALEAPERDRDV